MGKEGRKGKGETENEEGEELALPKVWHDHVVIAEREARQGIVKRAVEIWASICKSTCLLCLQCSRLNLSHFQHFLKMVMPNRRSQRLESIFLCTTQATPTGRQYDISVVVYKLSAM